MKPPFVRTTEPIGVFPSPGAPSESSPPAGVMSAWTASAPKTTSPTWFTEPLAAAALFKPVKNVFSQLRISLHVPLLLPVLPEASST